MNGKERRNTFQCFNRVKCGNKTADQRKEREREREQKNERKRVFEDPNVFIVETGCFFFINSIFILIATHMKYEKHTHEMECTRIYSW